MNKNKENLTINEKPKKDVSFIEIFGFLFFMVIVCSILWLIYFKPLIDTAQLLHADTGNHKLQIVMQADKIVLSDEYEEIMEKMWVNLDKENIEDLSNIVEYINENVYNNPYVVYQDNFYQPKIEINGDKFEILIISIDNNKSEIIATLPIKEDSVNYGKLVITPIVHLIMKASTDEFQENAIKLINPY